MAASNKMIEAIDDRRQKTVSGYIRTKIYIPQDIPKEIILVCILFYGNDAILTINDVLKILKEEFED